MTSPTNTADGTMRTARVDHVCTRSTWHQGCGRVIKAGEKYLAVKSPGLSAFKVCADCAAKVSEGK